MNITILTLFPGFFSSPFMSSILKRAIGKGIVTIEYRDIRSFTTDRHGRVDAPSVGGGAGLILQCQPIIDALKSCQGTNPHVILPSPRGKRFSQEDAVRLAREDHLLFICGHYEGIDERILSYVDETLSLGDFILTGGEIPTLAMLDSVIRLLPGVITDTSIEEESFDHHLLEYPQYALPYDVNGQNIPDILFSGNHEAIQKWRKKQSLLCTKSLRPDLFAQHILTKQEQKLLQEETPAKWEIEAIAKGKKFMKTKKEEK